MSKTGPDAMLEPTFREIERRLAAFDPPVKLRDHIVRNPVRKEQLEVHPLTLEGVELR